MAEVTLDLAVQFVFFWYENFVLQYILCYGFYVIEDRLTFNMSIYYSIKNHALLTLVQLYIITSS